VSFNSTDFNKIGDGIFLFEKFISVDEATNLYNIALSRTNWFSPSSAGASVTTEYEKDLEYIYKKMNNYFEGESILDSSCYFQKYEEGQSMGAHQDDNKVLNEIEKSKNYVPGVEYKEIKRPLYGTVLYLNTPELGGELIYTLQDIKYTPSPGDLVIHEADKKCTHMSSKVLKGNKVVFPSYAYSIIKVPNDK
jgi:hypothetical protein